MIMNVEKSSMQGKKGKLKNKEKYKKNRQKIIEKKQLKAKPPVIEAPKSKVSHHSKPIHKTKSMG